MNLLDPPCIVMTAVGTEEEASSLAAAIVQAHLAACVQVHRVRSFYIWRDAMHDEPEWVLMAKTRVGCYAALEAFIRERHSYETPEILQLPVTAGSSDYLRWLDLGTRMPIQA